MPQADDEIRFYFSFRSPYSWLAFLRIEQALARLPVRLEYVPVFPPPNFANDPAAVPNKLAYIQRDVARIADAYGFAAKAPEKLDTEWIRPHAAYVYSADQGKAHAFGRGVFEARFMQGKDVGEEDVLREVARGCGLDEAACAKAAFDEAYQTHVVQGMIRGVKEDTLFGVPYFVFRGETFWGNDRIDWLVRSIRKALGMPVVDLAADHLRPLDR
jgi:2-hydroxychromene-2-carboxylate isomerase